MFEPKNLEDMQKGIDLYNAKKFWECHEELEDVWADEMHSPVKYVSWAIIQVATSLYHVGNDNLAGAQGMLQKAKKKFEKCVQMKVETQYLYSSLDWKRFKELVYSINDEDNIDGFSTLYEFEFPRDSQ